jgi:hypothetical protein
MSPIKSSLAKTAKQLLGLRNTADLVLRGTTQRSKVADPPMFYEFKVWGAGGAGGQPGESGGGGAYITGQYEFNPGTQLTIVVGSGGLFPVGLNVANYGGGGPKGTQFSYTTGTGGGMSGIFMTSDTVFTPADSPTPAGAIASRPSAAPNVQPGATIQNCLIAAAGGGGSVSYGNGYGGGGGVTAGGNSANTDPATGGTWGGAGSDSGSGGTSDGTSPAVVNGGLFYGGSSTGGGGGGGGFYGGGGGGNSNEVSGGAGGASYYKTTQPSPPLFVGYNPGSFSNSTDGIPGNPGPNPTTYGRAGNRTDPLNGGSYGQGGSNGNAGQNGLVAYRKALSYPTLPGASWTSITHTGTDQTLIVIAD